MNMIYSNTKYTRYLLTSVNSQESSIHTFDLVKNSTVILFMSQLTFAVDRAVKPQHKQTIVSENFVIFYNIAKHC